MDAVKGLDEFLAAIGKIDKAKDEWGKEALKRVQDYSPVASGDLKNSWKITTEEHEIKIENTAVDEQGNYYAGFVEFGTVHDRGQYMATRTLAEGEQIWTVAKEKAGL